MNLKGGVNVTIILFIITLVILGGLLIGFFLNQNKINQLTKSLEETKNQVADVKKQSDEAKQNLADESKEGLMSIASEIKNVENPAIRLALTKAYAQRLRSLLTQSDRDDIDTVVVYFEKNPNILFSKNPSLPADVLTAINNLKTKAANLRNSAVATMQELDEAIYSPNEVVTLTGVIEYADSDEILGGSIFTLTDSSTGYVYFLHFNETNSENINENMIGQEVTLQVRVTSKVNEPLTFQVISGPTLTEEDTQETEATPQPTQ